ncbi:hypothetical protein BH10BAC2_BH10BAC2_20840 [soil metagenome]
MRENAAFCNAVQVSDTTKMPKEQELAPKKIAEP